MLSIVTCLCSIRKSKCHQNIFLAQAYTTQNNNSDELRSMYPHVESDLTSYGKAIACKTINLDIQSYAQCLMLSYITASLPVATECRLDCNWQLTSCSAWFPEFVGNHSSNALAITREVWHRLKHYFPSHRHHRNANGCVYLATPYRV
jgi:hypothetical protein